MCRDGSASDGEVYGEILATSRLSGMPTVLVSFGDPALFSDVRFHPCVKVKAWEADKVLTFVPPDGAFKLMSYRWGVDLRSFLRFPDFPGVTDFVNMSNISDA